VVASKKTIDKVTDVLIRELGLMKARWVAYLICVAVRGNKSYEETMYGIFGALVDKGCPPSPDEKMCAALARWQSSFAYGAGQKVQEQLDAIDEDAQRG